MRRRGRVPGGLQLCSIPWSRLPAYLPTLGPPGTPPRMLDSTRRIRGVLPWETGVIDYHHGPTQDDTVEDPVEKELEQQCAVGDSRYHGHEDGSGPEQSYHVRYEESYPAEPTGNQRLCEEHPYGGYEQEQAHVALPVSLSVRVDGKHALCHPHTQEENHHPQKSCLNPRVPSHDGVTHRRFRGIEYCCELRDGWRHDAGCSDVYEYCEIADEER